MVDFACVNLLRSLDKTSANVTNVTLVFTLLVDRCVTFQRTTSISKEKTLDQDLHVSF